MPESPTPRRIGCCGCLTLVALGLGVIGLHTALLLAQASINESKWQSKGSANYTITLYEQPIIGVYGTLRIQNERVIDAQPTLFRDFQRYQPYTVHGLFGQIRTHAMFPLSWETVEYDPDFGYPRKIRFNQWSLATDAPISIDVLDLVFDANP